MRNDKKRLVIIILAVISLIIILLVIYNQKYIERKRFNKFLPHEEIVESKGDADVSKLVLEINSEEEWVDFAQSTHEGCDYDGLVVNLNTDLDYSIIMELGETDNKEIEPGEFRGYFNGNANYIRNIEVGHSGPAGLFPELAGSIANLQIENGIVQGEYAGAIAGELTSGKILNCTVKNVSIAGNTELGIAGVIGRMGKVSNCISDYNYTAFNHYDLNKGLCRINIDNKSAFEDYYLWSDGDERPELTKEKAPKRITYRVNDEYQECFFSNEENAYICAIPNGKEVDKTSVTLVYDDENVVFPLHEENGSQYFNWGDNTYEVKYIENGNIPALYVNLFDEYSYEKMNSSKDLYFNGEYSLYDETGAMISGGGIEEMASRGNHSFNYGDRVGFRMTIGKEADFFGMGLDKQWILLPAYRDNSFLSYLVYKDLATAIGFPEMPKQQPVQLFFNGKYAGMYLLSERIELDGNRLGLSEKMYNNELRSFVVENQQDEDRANIKHPLLTTEDEVYILRYPREVSEKNIEDITVYLDKVNHSLDLQGKADEYGKAWWDYIDADSFAKTYMMFYLGAEKSLRSSIYFYYDSSKQSDDKLHIVRPWDVEHSFVKDNIELNQEDLFGGELPCAHFLVALHDDPEFKKIASRVWKDEILPAIKASADSKTGYVEGGLSSIDYYVEKYHVPKELDNALFPNDMYDKAEEIRQYFTLRADKITEEFN